MPERHRILQVALSLHPGGTERLIVLGTSNDKVDPESAASKVPKAFKALEEKMSAAEIVREISDEARTILARLGNDPSF